MILEQPSELYVQRVSFSAALLYDTNDDQINIIMASRRKPAPSPATIPSTLPPVDPQVQRYSLTDSVVSSDYHSVPTEHDPFREVASSVEGHSSAESHAAYTPYQPGQHLAPIITGETLQLDQPPAPSSNGHGDPFYDPTTPISQFAPPPLPIPQQEYLYAQDHYAPQYETETQPLPAGADIDHFSHDTEAYASGNYSRATYRPPRSRSPTPAVDDEDYYLVNDESIHYTGHLDRQGSVDPEKDVVDQRFSSYGMPYYTEEGYLPNGQKIVYDPEPETPTSTLYSLPPETPLETRHFGPAPSGRIVRRHKTKRRVQLTNGNLVVDLDVPPKLVLPYRGEPETLKTRYTAITCDPDDFEKKGFFLRQNEMGRRTELFIVITMYNVCCLFQSYVFFLMCIVGGRNSLLPHALWCYAQHLTSLHEKELANMGSKRLGEGRDSSVTLVFSIDHISR